MTELLDETKLREAATIAHRIAKNDSYIANKDAAVELGTALASIVGKSMETFLQIEQTLRNKLKKAALVVNQKMSDDGKLYGFLCTVSGTLRKCAKITNTDAFAKIAVFLLALVSPDEAATLKLSLHLP